ncbi:MAG: hypothetical protein F6K26_52675 [Moorea sp. SIO2I5]|nr:hypothetical protein [Moorena sp. SIO2I5]
MNRSRVGILPARKYIETGKMPVPRKMPIPRQDAYSTGATQGREGLLAALEART